MTRALESIESSEARRPDNLKKAGEFIARDLEVHAEKLEVSLNRLKGMIEADAERFAERQPLYQRKLTEILRGQPEEIGPAAIIMFY